MKKGKHIISKINNPKLKVEKIATYIMGWIGSTLSILTHTAIFLFFIIMCFLSPYTQEILLILTTVVSLEAIYLSIFIQMSMNTPFASIFMSHIPTLLFLSAAHESGAGR